MGFFDMFKLKDINGELEKAKSGSDAYAFAVVQTDRIRDICLKLIESIAGYPLSAQR